MLSIRELLNPASTPDRPSALEQGISSVEASPIEVALGNRRASRNPHLPRFREWATADVRQRGPVNFPPYENLSDEEHDELRRFHVRPLGQIRNSYEHIPYNSAKKDFYSKTGREGIEAFSYVFSIPGSETEYKVLWDYNVGLVRMTPFFKSLGYQKTKPSQMLDKNPGLRNITPSITGGSVSAQGYWMPYHCARAVCATFCHSIAGALIPIFGPSFPALCRRPIDPLFKDMRIDPAVIQEATRRVAIPVSSARNRSTTPQTPIRSAAAYTPLRRASLERQSGTYASHGLLSPGHLHSPAQERQQRPMSSWNPINGPSRGREVPSSPRETRQVPAVSRERLLPSGRRRNRFSSPPATSHIVTSPGPRQDPRRTLLPQTPRSILRPSRIAERSSSKRQCRRWDDEGSGSGAVERGELHEEGDVDVSHKPPGQYRRRDARSGRAEELHAATTLMGLRRD